MHFSSLTLLGLGALAIAAPVENANTLVARTGSTISCPKGSKSGCSTVPAGSTTTTNTDVYQDCLNVGLVNVVLCNVLNDLTVSVPIAVDVL